MSCDTKICTKCGGSKPLTEFYARKDGRRRTECKKCVLVAVAAYATANPNAVRATAAKWYQANKTRKRAASAKWLQENKSLAKSTSAAWREKNKDLAKRQGATYRLLNRGKIAACNKARKARKLHATPAWANKFIIEEAYALAQLRTKVMGFKWHVDHIVPLKSPLVCGLHTHDNLQVIPAVANLKKKNIWWPDMPEQVAV